LPRQKDTHDLIQLLWRDRDSVVVDVKEDAKPDELRTQWHKMAGCCTGANAEVTEKAEQ
jgi:hypothetical protein